jgi:dolichol kinase/membrane-associated phospholipid phosphatase
METHRVTAVGSKPLFGHAEKILVALALIGLVFAYAFNDELLNLIVSLRFSPMNEFMLFITKEGLAVLTALIGSVLLMRKRYVEFTLVVLAAIVGLESGYLMKKILHIPRPFATEALSDIALKFTTGYTLPSLHAVFCFSLLPFLRRGFGKGAAWWIIAFTLLVITFSRVYLGLHYVTDLIVGALIGYGSAKFWLIVDERFKVGARLVHQIRTNLELRRQIAHALTGIALIVLIKMNYVTAPILAAVLVAGTVMITVIRDYRVPGISHMLGLFERARDMKFFPGRGAFFFVLGSFLALLLFERQIALAGIAIMAVGDAATTVIGIYFGRFKNPFNPEKHLEGTMLAIIISTLAAFTFVDFHMAFFGAVAGIFVESLAIKFIDRVIDDNLLIPLVAGIVMTAVS